MAAFSPQQEQELRELIKTDNIINAIKLYRELTGVGLKEAKDAVEAMQRGEPVRQPIVPTQSGIQNDALLDEQIKQFLARRQKIQAVKIYRETQNCGLKDAKDAVDIIEAQMGREARTGLPISTTISDDTFAEDTQRNHNFLVLLIAVLLLVIGGLAFFFLAGNGF